MAAYALALDLDTSLPGDAVDTGWRGQGRELWIADDEGYVFVVDGDSVERWPRADPPIACA